MIRDNLNIEYSKRILSKIKSAVLKLEPEAEVFIFGSRARGDFKNDSDWDLLILLKGKMKYERERNIIHELNDLEIEERIIFNIVVHEQSYWNNDGLLKVTPFYLNVDKEKILI